MADILEEQAIRDNIGGFDKLSLAKRERMKKKRLKQEERRKQKAMQKQANNFDDMIQEVINLYCAGQWDQGAEAVVDMAHVWKAAGQSIETWLELMEHIDKTAVEKTGYESTRVHIKSALEKQGGGSRIILI